MIGSLERPLVRAIAEQAAADAVVCTLAQRECAPGYRAALRGGNYGRMPCGIVLADLAQRSFAMKKHGEKTRSNSTTKATALRTLTGKELERASGGEVAPQPDTILWKKQ